MIKKLLAWYYNNKRELPFRGTKDPYIIWLSEIIMQQTRIEQGLDYYYRFIEEYPELIDLANASQDDVLRMWQGLGYYSRARNLHFTANHIVKEFGGIFPKNYETLRKLKGIGDYTAAAIASIAFNEAVPAIDGNVFRVLSRVFLVTDSVNSTKTRNYFKKLAFSIIDRNNAGDSNQALIELGALVCKPRNPLCIECPVSTHCKAYAMGKQEELPVKKKNIASVNRYFYFLIIRIGDKTLISKRAENDIWKGLYQFPLFEGKKKLSDKQVVQSGIIHSKFISGEYIIKKVSREIKHILSHQVIFARFIHIDFPNNHKLLNNEFKAVDWIKLEYYALPRLITRYLEEEGNNLQ